MVRRLALALASSGLLFCWLLSFPQITHGWEADVHKGLTQWLALQVGFCPEDAKIIAQGNQEVDDNPETRPVLLGVKAILFNDIDASKTLRRYHFPTNGPLPADPDQRIIQHNSSTARDIVEFVVGVPYEGKSLRALKDLGRALHAYQDSWSHEGMPDTPVLPLFSIHPELAWSHPCVKGGWFFHDADLTHYYQTEMIDMANRTFEFLQQYHGTHWSFYNGAWRTILPHVQDFAKASTKQQKQQWFSSHGFQHQEAQHLTKDLNIPNKNPDPPLDPARDRRPKRCRNGYFKSEPPQTSAFSAMPTEYISGQGPDILIPLERMRYIRPDLGSQAILENTVRDFLNAWIVERDVDKAVTYVNTQIITEQLRPFGFNEQQSDDWAKKFFTMWLVEDHGLINLAGHALIPEYFTDLPLKPKLTEQREHYKIREYESLEGAIEGDGTKPYDISLIASENLETNIAPTHAVIVFRFKSIPRDALVLFLKRDTDSWQIIRLFGLVTG